MAADQKLLLTTQPEKPNHYTYLKEFRVEQCQSFLQHKCNQHRPYICFNWHFMNQRRRRPVRKRDGTFNYSADNYCVKYDETTGICPDGDECPFLHRTAGDTERRYHLRYYKTCMCVHDTDSRGYCVKNGHHCAFAHGLHDQRPPVFDIKEIESTQIPTEATVNGVNGVGAVGAGIGIVGSGIGVGVTGVIGIIGSGGGVGGGGVGCGVGSVGVDTTNGGPNALDKERNLMNEDPKWQDTNFVLANYKTEPCKRPPRLCRQGYACPQYHNSKDKRRSPRKNKYRSTPCPNVKHGEEWGEPANCEAGDNCQYCHTRTEQQFHPEIYKSTKCNDVQQAGYCPRSVFCAFAHVEHYISEEVPTREQEGPTNLALSDIISNALPPSSTIDTVNKMDKLSIDGMILQNGGGGESCESASTSSIGSNNSHSKAPGAQLHQQKNSNNIYTNNLNNNNNNNSNININNTSSTCTTNTTTTIAGYPEFSQDLTKSLMAIENDNLMGPLEKERRRMCLTFSLGSIDKFSNNIDEITRSNHLDNPISSGLLQNSTQPVNIPGSPMSNSLSGMLHGNGSTPVTIPGSSLSNYSPNNHTHLFSHNDNLFFQSHLMSPGLGDTLSISPERRISELNSSIRDELSNSNVVTNSLFENSMHNKQFSISPSIINPSLNEINRLRDELANQSVQKMHWEDRIVQATKACEAWKSEADDSNRKAALAEQQRDEALNHMQILTDKLEQANVQNGLNIPRDFRGMSIQKLKGWQTRLRSDLEEIEKVLYLETATKCMKCEENNRSITLAPCNHYVLCDICAKNVHECPYCQTIVTSQA